MPSDDDLRRLQEIDRVLFLAKDAAKVAEDFLRNLLGAHGPDVTARLEERRGGRWQRWTDRERISNVVVGGDQLRRAQSAVDAHRAELEHVKAVKAPQRVWQIWESLLASLDASRIEAGVLDPSHLDIANSRRSALIGDLLKRVLAAGAALEQARLRLLLEANRAGPGPIL